MLRAPYARALCVVKITILIMDDFDNVCLTLQSVCKLLPVHRYCIAVEA